jgi:hypothetical protein
MEVSVRPSSVATSSPPPTSISPSLSLSLSPSLSLSRSQLTCASVSSGARDDVSHDDSRCTTAAVWSSVATSSPPPTSIATSKSGSALPPSRRSGSVAFTCALRVAEQGHLAPLDHGAGSFCRSLYAIASMLFLHQSLAHTHLRVDADVVGQASHVRGGGPVRGGAPVACNTIQQGFHEESLEFNRDINRVLKIQQGLQWVL